MYVEQGRWRIMPCQRYIEREILLLIIKDKVVYMEICARHRHILRLWKSIWRFHQSKWENQFALEFMSDSGFTQTPGLFLDSDVHIALSLVLEWKRDSCGCCCGETFKGSYTFTIPLVLHTTHRLWCKVAPVLNKHPFPHLETRQDAQHSSNSLDDTQPAQNSRVETLVYTLFIFTTF